MVKSNLVYTVDRVEAIVRFGARDFSHQVVTHLILPVLVQMVGHIYEVVKRH